MNYITHDEIGELVRDRLKSKGYEVAFSNMIDQGAGEQPDCLGINLYGESILIEAKVSRSDFQADKHKAWREEGKGIGKRRVYVTPMALLKPCEIPYGWELWEVQDNKRKTIKVVKGMVVKKINDKSISCWPIYKDEYRNTDKEEMAFFSKTDDTRKLNMMMIKIFRRMNADGLQIDNYSKGNYLIK